MLSKFAKTRRNTISGTFFQRGRMTNSLKEFETFINSVKRTKYCAFFMDPVGKDVPDYYDIIKEPMDIGTIVTRLKDNYYCSIMEAIEDFQKILRNCVIYNKEGSECHKCGLLLKRSFQQKLIKFPLVEQDYVTPVQRGLQRGSRTPAPRPPVFANAPLIADPPHIVECKKILSSLVSFCPEALNHFAQPLDITHTHTGDRYSEVILEPIDLLTIRTKFKYHMYENVEEFLYDMRLIYLNGLQLYKPSDDIHKDVELLRTTFENLFSFYDTYDRLPNETEMPYINTPWDMPNMPNEENDENPDSSDDEWHATVQDPELQEDNAYSLTADATATMEVPDMKEKENGYAEAADVTDCMSMVRKRFTRILKLERALAKELGLSVLQEDLALSESSDEESTAGDK